MIEYLYNNVHWEIIPIIYLLIMTDELKRLFGMVQYQRDLVTTSVITTAHL